MLSVPKSFVQNHNFKIKIFLKCAFSKLQVTSYKLQCPFTLKYFFTISSSIYLSYELFIIIFISILMDNHFRNGGYPLTVLIYLRMGSWGGGWGERATVLKKPIIADLTSFV